MAVLGIPVINRPDLLAKCIASIDHPVRLVIVDNSTDGFAADIAEQDAKGDYFVTEPPANLGVAASINFVIRTHPHEPLWLFANADTEFGRGDIARVIEATTADSCVRISDWRLFSIGREVIERVGFWDENYHPAFVEDCDWEWRCHLAGVDILTLDGATSHVGSVSIQEERNARNNARTYPANLRYHQEKWGGPPRGGERFTTPFDQGGHVGDWRLRLRRLRDNEWL